jgi:hypothetical protein
MLLETTIGLDSVKLEIEGNQISFSIGDCFVKADNSPNKVAITKWLLKSFKEAKTHYNFLYASPYEADGKLADRIKAFSKVGFTYQWGVVLWFSDTCDITLKEKILKQAEQNYNAMKDYW